MKTINKKFAVAGMAIALIFACAPHSFAGSQSVNHVVTVSVPTILEFSADTTNFTLTFSDYLQNSETDTKTVIYSVKANNMTKTTGVMNAKLDGLFTDVDLKADTGAYTKASGNASLIESASGFATILAASAVNLANRVTDSGNGKTLRGTIPVTYKAVATNDLQSGNLSQTLTVSLLDT